MQTILYFAVYIYSPPITLDNPQLETIQSNTTLDTCTSHRAFYTSTLHNLHCTRRILHFKIPHPAWASQSALYGPRTTGLHPGSAVHTLHAQYTSHSSHSTFYTLHHFTSLYITLHSTLANHPPCVLHSTLHTISHYFTLFRTISHLTPHTLNSQPTH